MQVMELTATPRFAVGVDLLCGNIDAVRNNAILIDRRKKNQIKEPPPCGPARNRSGRW
jgi:hypothetical protein